VTERRASPAEANTHEPKVRPALPQELERVAELWSAITEHHARIDPFFRQRAGAEAAKELQLFLGALQRDRDSVIFVIDAPSAPDAASAASAASEPSNSVASAPSASAGTERSPSVASEPAARPLAGICIVRIDHAPPILEETERAEITDLGVRPEYRRQGIGTRLVEAAFAWVRAAGVERIEVQVAVGNPEGQAFWREHGFGDLMDVLHRRL
jgi:ribosomal protein S18 acetylase RimI-like enzyme